MYNTEAPSENFTLPLLPSVPQNKQTNKATMSPAPPPEQLEMMITHFRSKKKGEMFEPAFIIEPCTMIVCNV